MNAAKTIENIETSSVNKIESHLNQLIADCHGLLDQLHLATQFKFQSEDLYRFQE